MGLQLPFLQVGPHFFYPPSPIFANKIASGVAPRGGSLGFVDLVSGLIVGGEGESSCSLHVGGDG